MSSEGLEVAALGRRSGILNGRHGLVIVLGLRRLDSISHGNVKIRGVSVLPALGEAVLGRDGVSC